MQEKSGYKNSVLHLLRRLTQDYHFELLQGANSITFIFFVN